MQTANIMLALGGDTGNTVPKYNVTAAEIAVLQAIHGEDAVFDIEPLGEVSVSNREELDRLVRTYGGAKDNSGKSIVLTLYPGATARVITNLKDLNFVPEQFKPTERTSAPEVVDVPEEVEEAPAPKVAKKAPAKKAKKADEDADDLPADDDVLS